MQVASKGSYRLMTIVTHQSSFTSIRAFDPHKKVMKATKKNYFPYLMDEKSERAHGPTEWPKAPQLKWCHKAGAKPQS